jgi:glycosyltransferase involved in cell wall biosynthesis
VVVHVGRAAPEKNRVMLPRIVRAMPCSATLTLAGATTTHDLCLDASDELWSRTRTFGLLTDIRELLWAGDLLLLPSVREGLPLVVLEAVACGRPVVASDLPRIRYIAAVLPDVHLVPRGATPEVFAAVIEHVQESKRTEDDIRQALIDAGLGLDRAVMKWTELCRPRGQAR